MQFSRSLLALVYLVPSLLAMEIPNPEKLEIFESGKRHMQLMDLKEKAFAKHKAAGAFVSSQYQTINQTVPCVNGKAGEFRCSNIDLHYFASHADLGSSTGQGSSSWGWTSDDGREIIIIAQADGASFSEVTKDGKLDYLGRLPNTAGSEPKIWREIRVLDHYAVIGSESVNHQVQIFDLRKLLTIKSKPYKFDSVKDLTSLWKGLPVGRTHNIVIDHERKYAVAVGAQPRDHKYKSGLLFIDLKNPANPTLAGVQAEDGYVHDAQILPYKGPDTRYKGKTIAYGYNEDTLTIYDVTNPANATIISRTGYEGASYTHQGWVLDPANQEYLIMDDEYDEVDAAGPAKDGYPITYIWDIKDLKHPRQTGTYRSAVKGIDHNQYISNGKSYQSQYGNGFRILDVSSIPSDPTGAGVKEIGFFDIYPEDDNEEGGGSIDFVGSWSSYALFKSGWIVINTIERGAYVVKYTGKQ